MDRSYNSLRDSGLDTSESDREISLGTGTVLAIFFGLALVCALFFGLGYSMGRRSIQTVAVAPAEAPVLPSSSTANKPLSGSPAEGSTGDLTVSVKPASTPAALPQTSQQIPAPAVAIPSTVVPPPVVPLPPASFLVQIAAVSHREDADILVTNLQQRGYDVAIRQEPQDKLLHVQIGPFPSRKDAEAMRQHLLSDGYNAIVK